MTTSQIFWRIRKHNNNRFGFEMREGTHSSATGVIKSTLMTHSKLASFSANS